MNNKLDTLTNERKATADKLAELEAQRMQTRAAMEKDPARLAAALAPKYGNIQTQIEVFTAKLGEVDKQIEAEQARLNSPAVQKGLKRAEKIVAEGNKLHSETVAELQTIVSKIDGVLAASQEAANLLTNGGKNFLDYSGPFTELSQIRQVIGAYTLARSERANLTAGLRQADAARKAREAAKAKEEEAARAATIAKRKAEAEADRTRRNDERRAWLGLGG